MEELSSEIWGSGGTNVCIHSGSPAPDRFTDKPRCPIKRRPWSIFPLQTCPRQSGSALYDTVFRSSELRYGALPNPKKHPAWSRCTFMCHYSAIPLWIYTGSRVFEYKSVKPPLISPKMYRGEHFTNSRLFLIVLSFVQASEICRKQGSFVLRTSWQSETGGRNYSLRHCSVSSESNAAL